MTTIMLLFGIVIFGIGIYINNPTVTITGQIWMVGSILYGKIEATK